MSKMTLTLTLENFVEEEMAEEYIATLTQSGTSAPVVNVIKDTIPGTKTWSYVSTGLYMLSCANAFPSNKTAPEVSLPSTGLQFNNIMIGIERMDASSITVTTRDTTGPQNSLITVGEGALVRITVFP